MRVVGIRDRLIEVVGLFFDFPGDAPALENADHQLVVELLTEGTDEFMDEKRDKALQMIAAGQSLQSNLETDDLTGTIVYLASESSKFVTGQTIMVDGGTVML